MRNDTQRAPETKPSFSHHQKQEIYNSSLGRKQRGRAVTRGTRSNESGNMGFMNRLFGRKGHEACEAHAASLAGSSQIPAAQLVEDIVENLRQKPLTFGEELCYVVLFGDRPFTAFLQKGEEDILCFTSRVRAESFMQRYHRLYHPTKPVTVLAIGHMSELWAMLNNLAKDEKYRPPYGLIINFNYAGQPYGRHSVADLKRIGLEGLNKGFGTLPQQ
jgi:hypothetical protein